MSWDQVYWSIVAQIPTAQMFVPNPEASGLLGKPMLGSNNYYPFFFQTRTQSI
jgi:hypothetical protein